MRRGRMTARSLGAAVAVASALTASVAAAPPAGAADACGNDAGWAGGPPVVTMAGRLAEGRAVDIGQAPIDVVVTGQTALVVDGAHNVVRSIDLASGIEVVRVGNGSSDACVADGTPARSAALSGISSVAPAPDGGMFVASTTVIYRVRPDGTVQRIAGSVVGGAGGDGGPALSATLDHVSSLTPSPDGSLYFVQPFANVIRRIDDRGVITRVASGSLRFPTGLARAADGSLLVADAGNERIVRVSPGGATTTLASTTGADGSIAVAFGQPQDVAVAADGAIIVTAAGSTWRIAGRQATLLANVGGRALAVDGERVLVADSGGARVLGIVAGRVEVMAGTGTAGSGDGLPASQAQLGQLGAVAVAGDGAVYFADGARIRRMGTDGRVTAFAGSGAPPGAGSRPGDGQPAATTAFEGIGGIALGPDNLVYFTDRTTRSVLRVSTDGLLTRVAGGGSAAGAPPATGPRRAGDGGPARNAEFKGVADLAFGPGGDLYVSDAEDHTVRRIGPDGIITTIAGNGVGSQLPSIEGSFSGDGGPATEAGLSRPSGLAIDGSGNLYIADTWNDRIRRVDRAGRITTILGPQTPLSAPREVGAGITRPSRPTWIEADTAGNLYFNDPYAGYVHRVDAAGFPEMVAGGGDRDYPADGTAATRLRTRGVALAVDPRNGDLVLADAHNHRLRRLPGLGASGALVRLGGSDRLMTAIGISRSSFEPGAAAAVTLSRADSFADALAGGPLAATSGGPLLLTPSFGLDPFVEAELRRVLPAGGPVHLLGGTTALSADLESRVRSLGYQVRRFEGADRFATAVSIARDGLGGPTAVLLASGTDFPDALAASAAAAHTGAAVLLTDGPRMPPATGDYLRTRTPAAIALGGPARTAAPGVEALVGADRYATAAMVAARFFPNATVAAVASGRSFPDALAGGARVGRLGGPLLLSEPDVLPEPTRRQIVAIAPSRIELYGGGSVLSDAVRAALQASVTP